MIAFALAAAVMAAIALAWIVVPLTRKRNRETLERERTNLAILRDQRAELERDLANGVITHEHYEATIAELDRRVLEETEASRSAATSAPPLSGHLTAAIVAVVLPVAAAAMYVAWGTPAAIVPELAEQQARAAGDGAHQISPEELDRMLAQLAQRLEQEPDNAEGWAVLARSYYARGKPELSVKAFERAAALLPNDAQLLADYADVLALVQGRTLAGKPMQLVQQALKADPTQWKALMLAGTDAFNRKDYASAVGYWERAKLSVPPTSPIAQSIDGSIAEARDLGKLGPAPPSAMAAAPKAPPIAPDAPNPHATPGAGRPVTPGATIAGTVALAPDLARSAKPDDVVFIFARAAQGPRTPLALLTKRVRELPASFTLDDSQAMSPQMTLSGASEVIVGARVSRTGNAMPQSGDFEGLSPPVKVGTKGLALVIDRTLP